MSTKSKHTCVACGGTELFDFYERRNVPANTGYLAKSESEAKSAACGNIVLEFCKQCGLIHNRLFDPGLVKWVAGYDASLFHSPGFVSSTSELANELITKYELNEKSVLEIGCGKAHLLRTICEKTSIRAVGIDPTVVDTTLSIGNSELRLIKSGLRRSHEQFIGDLVICVSVIEDIEEPLNFLRMLRGLIGDRRVALYFELFDGLQAIVSGNAWSPHYEQCNYFGETSIRTMFQRAGFRVDSVGSLSNHKQYLFVEAVADSTVQHPSDEGLADLIRQVRDYEHTVGELVHTWSLRMHEWKRANKKVVLWGSGGKAISFLSMISHADCVQAVVDVNPNRQGLFTPKTATPIIAPTELLALKPDVVVISNPAYRTEIESALLDLGLNCQLEDA